MKYSIIVPCYNEEDNIYDLVGILEKVVGKRNVEFILVENGSIDNTRKVLEDACTGKALFKIVPVDINRGYGYGIISGMRAATGDYIGWIHADLQISPNEMMKFVDYVERYGKDTELFMKGIRTKRNLIDHIFTGGMTVFVTLMLQCHLYDIGAIPVLFHRSLLKRLGSKTPYDFSIETYVYYQAKRSGMNIKRFKIKMKERMKGESSWNKGILSKFRQSKVIMSDIIKIRKGIKVR